MIVVLKRLKNKAEYLSYVKENMSVVLLVWV